MRVLDLFAGLQGWSEPWIAAGHEVVTTDLDPRFGCTITADVRDLTPDRLLGAFTRHDEPLVVLASPPCEAFSVLRIGRNWTHDHQPKTDQARLGMELLEYTVGLIDALHPFAWVIENPRAKMRRMPVLAPFERRTVTYCKFGEPFMKPTDLFGGFPSGLVLPEPCSPYPRGPDRTVWIEGVEYARDGRTGAPCHVAAPRGSKTGIQGTGTVDVGWSGLQHPPVGKTGRDESDPDWQRNRRGNLTEHKRIHREILGTSDSEMLAALRAKIPWGLSATIMEACERAIDQALEPEGQLRLV